MTRHQFDAIIIGFGKGGKTLAAALGNAGLQTALIEKSPEMYGGTCINVGCIPTKFLVHKSHEAKSLDSFAKKQIFYQQAIEQEKNLTEKLREKNLQKLITTPNVTLINGTARLIANDQVEVQSPQGIEILQAKRIFLNTGSVPIVPAIEGIQDNPHVVFSEDLLAQTILPKHLVIIGGGYIGIEFASIYADFGSQVTIVQKGSVFLPREDADIAQAVLSSLQERGINVLLDAQTLSINSIGGKAQVLLSQHGKLRTIEADTVLVATGRRPNIDDLGLEQAGVLLNNRGGVVTNESLQTTNPQIYAMGDVVGDLQFTYISLDDYRIVRSAVLGDGAYTKTKRGLVPYSVFLNPPLSRVGMSEEDALRKGHEIVVGRLPAMAIPKAHVVEHPVGLLKAIIDKKTGYVLGAHLFCEESHEMINLVKLAMDAKLHYSVLRDMIFTHPTMSESLNDLFSV